MNHAPTAETRHQPFEKMELHRHARPYAALVLDGGFEEHGPDGRFVCEVGSLLVRPPWQQHADEFGKHGAIVLNLPIESIDGFLYAHVSNVEAVASLAARSPGLAGSRPGFF